MPLFGLYENRPWLDRVCLFVGWVTFVGDWFVSVRTLPRQSVSMAHEGARSSKLTFLGTKEKLVSVGFTKQSQRQFKIWDPRNLTKEVKRMDIDQAAGEFGARPWNEKGNRNCCLVDRLVPLKMEGSLSCSTGKVAESLSGLFCCILSYLVLFERFSSCSPYG